MKKLLVLLLLGMFFISFVSAADWDNWVSYKNENKIVNIDNLFGFGETYATAKITSHSDLSKPIYVGTGWQRVMTFEIDSKQDYQDAIKGIEFENMKTGKADELRYYWVKGIYGDIEVDDFEERCNEIISINGSSNYQNCKDISTGTHTENKIIGWEVLESSDLKQGKITIGLMVFVNPNDYYDGKPVLFGKKVSRWASWTSALNSGILAYYQLNETVGNTASGYFNNTYNFYVDGNTWRIGRIGNGYDPGGNEIDNTNINLSQASIKPTASDGLTINFWLNVTGDVGIDNYHIIDLMDPSINNNGEFRTQTYNDTDIQFEVVDNVGVKDLRANAYNFGVNQSQMITLYMNSTLAELFINGTSKKSLAMTDFSFNSGYNITFFGRTEGTSEGLRNATIDEVGIWRRRLTASELTNLYNLGLGITPPSTTPTIEINITYPYPTTYSTITHDLNYTYSITGGGTADSCWYSLNKGNTNSTRQNCGTNWTSLTASEGANTWTVYGNATTGEMGNTTRDFTVTYPNPVVNITFPYPTTYPTNILDLNYTASLTSGSLDSCWYSLNKGQTNSSKVNCGINWTSLTASEGANTWTVYANSSVGKMSNSTVTFTTNTTPMIEFSGDTPNNYVNQTYNSLFVNVTLTETYYNNITFNLYNNSYYNINSTIFTDGTRQINWTTAYDGDYTYNATMWTTTNLYNSTLTRHIKIDSVAPTINITNPLNGSVYTTGTAIENNITIILNWTAVDPTLQNCWVFNGTANNTVNCGSNGTYINVIYGNHTFYFYANDSVGHIATTSVSAHWVYNFLESSITYNATTFETSKESFVLNMSSGVNILTISSMLNYNGTLYPSISNCTSGECIIMNSLDVPEIINIPIQLNNFSWVINIFNGSNSINVNSSANIQNVLRIYMTKCNASNTLEVANFTNYEEENRTKIYNFDFAGTFSYWTGDGSIKKNITILDNFVNESRLCVSNESILYHSDATMKYKPSSNTSGLSYVQRSYYFINTSLNHTLSKKVELYSLLSSDSTSFILEVYDDAQLPIKNAYLYLQKYYSGENIFKTIEMAKTDSTGSSIGHFKAEVEDYRIIIEKDFSIIYQGGTQKIVCKETPCTITLQTSSITGVTWKDFGSITNFVYTLNFNNATNLWTFQYVDTSGSIGYGRLYVYTRHPVSGESMICNETSPLIAATLTCDVSGNNGTIYANAYLSRSPEILVFSKTSLISTLKQIFGLEGLFLSMFILLLLGLAGLWNPAVGIILEVAGVIMINLLGIASFGVTTIIGLIFIAAILLWELKN